jgi:hypothetical protein
LDLKQKHANAFEARFARDQAALTARQGQTIMVFTIVTIIFLPLSFIAAVFAINIDEFPHDAGPEQQQTMPFRFVAKWMFGIGFGVSIPLVILAFAVDEVARWFRKIPTQVRGFVEGLLSKMRKGGDSEENGDEQKYSWASNEKPTAGIYGGGGDERLSRSSFGGGTGYRRDFSPLSDRSSHAQARSIGTGRDTGTQARSSINHPNRGGSVSYYNYNQDQPHVHFDRPSFEKNRFSS